MENLIKMDIYDAISILSEMEDNMSVVLHENGYSYNLDKQKEALSLAIDALREKEEQNE